MLCKEIISPDYPTLHLQNDDVAQALTLQASQGVASFPVLANEDLAGLLAVEKIDTLSKETKISALQYLFDKVFVLGNAYFLTAFEVMNSGESRVVPVVDDDNKYLGTITQTSILHALGVFTEVQSGRGGLLVLKMDKISYAFSELSRIIESCEANILKLDTYYDVKTETFMVAVCVNRANVSDIVSVLQHYRYEVIYSFGDEPNKEDLQHNYEALMHYLNI